MEVGGCARGAVLCAGGSPDRSNQLRICAFIACCTMLEQDESVGARWDEGDRGLAALAQPADSAAGLSPDRL